MKTIRYLFNLLKKNKSTIILFIFGLILISLIIYNRVFRTRESVEIVKIVSEFNLNRVLLYSYLIIINLVHLFFLIGQVLLDHGLLKSKKKSKYRVAWYRYLLLKLGAFGDFFITSVETVYGSGIKKIRKLDHVLEVSSYIFINYPNQIRYGFVIFILCCQFIVLTTLVLDVFYFLRFHWFYKSLILLLGPILSKAFCYMLKDYAKEGIQYTESFAHITYDKENKSWGYEWRTTFLKDDDPDGEKLYSLGILHSSLKRVINIIELIKEGIKYSYVAQILQGVKSILYIITWGYLVFLMIHG